MAAGECHAHVAIQRTPVCQEHSMGSTFSFVPGHGYLPGCLCRSLRRLHTPNQGRTALPVPVGHQLLTRHRHRLCYGSPGTLYKTKVRWHACTGRRKNAPATSGTHCPCSGANLPPAEALSCPTPHAECQKLLHAGDAPELVCKCTLTATTGLKRGQLACLRRTQSLPAYQNPSFIQNGT